MKRFDVEDLGSFVVIAGQNGSGKSCVFDAIRLLKSVYGGYQANEYHQWFGEFAVNLQDKQSIRKLFRDPRMPIEIRAEISFDESEVLYLRENVEALVQPIAWQEVTGQPVDWWTWNKLAIATQLRQQGAELAKRAEDLAKDVRAALVNTTHVLALRIDPYGDLSIAQCKPAEAAFQAYEPDHLGLIEYHSASRSYSRQAVGGINLDTRAFEDQRRQHRLYNWKDKYQNVKTELATSYLRSLIAEKSGDAGSMDDLNETLSELFRTFFPDKTYQGVRPQPSGGLEFPVRVSSGEIHDIDELSSGEKEILYGYLKLRNATPRNSVLLIDEPELHLNPSLLQGYTDFYYRHLGLEQNNQLWLVTHSDALLRQAVGNTNYRVYHMVPATTLDSSETANQAVEVLADDDVERVTIDLVGDLAAYRPNGKVVVLEGQGENGFDVTIVKRLFPNFARRVNLISGGHKRRVRDLYTVLRESAVQAGLKNRFFAVVDKDSDPQLAASAGASEFSWDVYHIENYLLDASSVRAATATLQGSESFVDDDAVTAELRDCAKELIDGLVMERTSSDINDQLIRAIRIAGAPGSMSPGSALSPSITASIGRIRELGADLSVLEIERRANVYREKLTSALENDLWLSDFPGRKILKRYVDRQFRGKIETSLFMNAILNKMVENGVEPEGMRRILGLILAG